MSLTIPTAEIDELTGQPVMVEASASNPTISVFEAGDVLGPRIAVDRTLVPTRTGKVHFDDETGATRISTKVTRSPSGTGAILVDLSPIGDERVEVQVLGHTVFDGEAHLASTFEDTTMTVADLDGSVDEADWIQHGHVLDADEVAYLRSLVLPWTVRRRGTT